MERHGGYENMVAEFKPSDLPSKMRFSMWRPTVATSVEAIATQKRRISEWIDECFKEEATVESVTDGTEFALFDGKLKEECLRICTEAARDEQHATCTRIMNQTCERH